MCNRFALFFTILISGLVHAQKPEYAAALIPKELTENADAVVRFNEETLTIKSQNSLSYKCITACTVFNEYGMRSLNSAEDYSPTKHISKIEARVYDKAGYPVRVFKRKDFKDVSLGDGYSVFNDDRMLYLDYTPVDYPFTMVFECEYTTTNTAQLPAWSALSGYFASTQSDVVHVVYPPGLGFAYKEMNFGANFDVVKTEKPGELTFAAYNIPAVKRESESPEFYRISPTVAFRLDKFSLEGVSGQASDWKQFGKWYYDELLTGTDEIPAETQARIKQLIAGEKDELQIARKIYNYVQDKTRYVSIQVGIGGYKPMKAADVDRLGYGDCKALSNYTRALLAVAGIQSYFTLVYAGDESRRSILDDFVSQQGNHAILAMPYKGDYVWLECTSQVSPFGFQGMFTDGRSVLVVKPDGGEIAKTKSFVEKDNSQIASGSYKIAADGSLSGTLSTANSGAAYDEAFGRERLAATEQEKYYKQRFSNIGNLKIEKAAFSNDRDKISFTENLDLSALNYANPSGNRLIFALNAFHPFMDTPKRYRSRQNPFEVQRGYFEKDEISISIPEGFDIEVLPSDVDVKTKYGEYQAKVVRKSPNLLLYERTLLMKDGYYPNSEYEDFRQFCEQVAKSDVAKAVLLKKT